MPHTTKHIDNNLVDLPDPRGHLKELVDVPRLEQLGQVAEQGAQVCAEPRLALLDDRRVQGKRTYEDGSAGKVRDGYAPRSEASRAANSEKRRPTSHGRVASTVRPQRHRKTYSV